MKYPQLVPKRICTSPITVYRESGLNRDGSPKQTAVFSGKCFYSEKTKQIITLSGEALFNGDIAPDTDVISGEVVVLTGIRRKIYASEKAKNPDGTVNYTRLELI